MTVASNLYLYRVMFDISFANGNCFSPFWSMVMDCSSADVVPVIPQNSTMSSMSEIPLSPTSVASSGHFPFTASEISGMGVDTSALDTTFTSDVASNGLQLGPDGGGGRSLDQIQWTFSLSDLTADLSNLGGKLIWITYNDHKACELPLESVEQLKYQIHTVELYSNQLMQAVSPGKKQYKLLKARHYPSLHSIYLQHIGQNIHA